MKMIRVTLINKKQFSIRSTDIIQAIKDENNQYIGAVILALPTNTTNVFAKRIRRTFAPWFIESMKEYHIDRFGV